MITNLLKRPWYPAVLQWLSVALFVPIVGYLLFGPAAKDNHANLLVWLVWWPLLCVLFILAGRIWCGICPFSKVSDGIQHLAGLRRAVPEFLKSHGVWLILIAFVLLSWLEETRGILDSPRQTAVLLLTILTGAIAFGLFFQGRTWCRHVCPIGGLSQVYSRGALLKIRNQEALCADCNTKDCVVPDHQYAGCPMQLSPFAMDTVANCNLCGGCVKRCQHGSLRVRLEAPSQDLAAESPMAPVVLWLVAALTGLIGFLNSLESSRLPLEAWVEQSGYPILAKTLLMALALGASWWLLRLSSRLAAGPQASLMSPAAWMALGARPLIPLLLFSHLGHVGMEFWEDGGHLLAPLASLFDAPGLALPGLWGADWTRYFNVLSIGLGIMLSLAVLLWTAQRAVGLGRARLVLSFGVFYLLVAGWYGFTAWPSATSEPEGVSGQAESGRVSSPAISFATEAGGKPGNEFRVQPDLTNDQLETMSGQPESRAVAISVLETGDRFPPTVAEIRPFPADSEQGGDDGWSILWPFIGINVALLALALIVRQAGGGAGAENEDFSATKTWNLNPDKGAASLHTELLDWLIGQTAQARWRVPAAVALANAAQEVIAYLQGALPANSKITVLAILRKNKGVMTISHSGKPLSLPDFRGAVSLEAAEGDALAGIELRLAAKQVEHLSYHARMSDSKCSFSLRQSL